MTPFFRSVGLSVLTSTQIFLISCAISSFPDQAPGSSPIQIEWNGEIYCFRNHDEMMAHEKLGAMWAASNTSEMRVETMKASIVYRKYCSRDFIGNFFNFATSNTNIYLVRIESANLFEEKKNGLFSQTSGREFIYPDDKHTFEWSQRITKLHKKMIAGTATFGALCAAGLVWLWNNPTIREKLAYAF